MTDFHKGFSKHANAIELSNRKPHPNLKRPFKASQSLGSHLGNTPR